MCTIPLFLVFSVHQGRGPKKHLKRLNAPKHWLLGKMDGVWAPKVSNDLLGPSSMSCFTNLLPQHGYKWGLYVYSMSEFLAIVVPKFGACKVLCAEDHDEDFTYVNDMEAIFTTAFHPHFISKYFCG